MPVTEFLREQLQDYLHFILTLLHLSHASQRSTGCRCDVIVSEIIGLTARQRVYDVGRFSPGGGQYHCVTPVGLENSHGNII